MADYWKSNDRKFCDFCKCWIADNKPSVAFHENGKRHKEAVAKRISEISRSSAKNERDQQKMDMQLRKMEEAARLAYAEDISRNADISSQNYNRALAAAEAASKTDSTTIGPSLPSMGGHAASASEAGGSRPSGGQSRRQIDPVALPMDAQELAELEARRLAASRGDGNVQNPEDPTLWCETVSDEGHTYYWNVKTNETVWDKPKQGYLTLFEYNNIMEQARTRSEEHAQQEKRFMVENADELAAKYNREKLKQRRMEYEAKQRMQDEEREKAQSEGKKVKKEKKKSSDDEEEEEEQTNNSSGNYSAAAPFGKWQTVEVKPQPVIDLQLPKQANNQVYYAPVEEPKPVVKVFKEKVATLDQETISGESGAFKKRKINISLKKNSRQRFADD